MSTMFRTQQEQDPGIPMCSGGFDDDVEENGGLGRGAEVSCAAGARGMRREDEDGFVAESKIESAAGACILWSTVGVGCLVGGRPKSWVSQPHHYYHCSCAWLGFEVVFVGFAAARVCRRLSSKHA